jgi:hypothetical protein
MHDIAEYENGLTTNQLARLAITTPGNIRVRLCQTGSFFGVKPLKLPSKRLLWPADSLARLAAFKAEKPEAA